MNETSRSSGRRAFAERLRQAVDENAEGGRRSGRHRSRRRYEPVLSPTANPDRVRYSDELFVDRVRKALD